MGVFSFDSVGKVVDACVLNTNDVSMYKVKVNMHHAVMPLTDFVIYREVKPGPFKGPGDSIYPEWAPDGSDPNEFETYTASLRKLLDN